MRDIDPALETHREYECIQCGSIVTSDEYSGACPDCDAELRNRRTPLE